MSDTISTAEIRVVADASGVEAGLRQATDAAQRAQREMSGGSERSARSQQNLVQAIQRTTAQMEAGSRTSARYFEVLAQQRGVDPAALQPYLQQLRAIEQAQQGTGQSAAQTTNAMRQLPAQITDIVTSLQGGMEPLTVLIQQGGQLRDSFGGIGPAARALGGQIMALINPYTMLAAATVAVGAAYLSSIREADAYARAIGETGNAAGVTKDQLAEMARQLGKGDAAEALLGLTKASQVSGENMQRFAAVAIEGQRLLGKSIADTVDEFDALGDAPSETLSKLNDKYHFLTAEVYAQVKALEDQGRAAEAATAAQLAYADEMERRKHKVLDTLSDWERGWLRIKKWTSEATNAVFGMADAATDAQKLTSLLKDRDQIEQNIVDAQKSRDTWYERAQKGLLERNKNEINAIRAKIDADKAAAKAEADGRALAEARMKWDDQADAYATKAEKREKEITKARNEGAAAGASQAEIEERIGKIREKYKEKDSGDAARKAAAGRRAEAQLLAELSGVTGSYMEDLSRLNGQYAKGNLSQERYVDLVTELISKQPGAKKMIDETAKEMADYAKATTSAEEALGKELDAITKQVQATRDHNAQIGLSVQQIAELEAERLESMANRLEENAIIAEGLDLTGAKAEGLRQEAEAYRDLAQAKREGGAKQAAADSAKQLTQDWKRATESMQQSLTDALMRGFESGKGFGRNLVDTIKNMFNTLVLRPIVSAIVNPVAGAVTSAFGVPGVASAAATGGGGGAGGLGMSAAGAALGSYFGAGGIAGSVMAGAGWVTGATTLSGSLAAAGSLAATGTLGGIASSIGMVAGALGPIALGIGAAVAIWKKLDTSGTYHMGGASSASSSGSTTIRAESIGFEKTRINAETEKMTATLASGVVEILDSTALAFGQTAGYTAATAFADDTSRDGAWGALVISKMGQSVVDWRQGRTSGWAPKEFADGEKGQQEYLAALTSSVRSALNSIGLPDWARTMLDGVASDASLEDLANVVDQINKTQAALAAMRTQLVGFASLSDSAMSSLMAASGGIDKLFSNASAYYDAFYTEAEKNATVSGQIAKALAAVNLQMPTSREGFRALVEAQTQLGAQGAESLSVLLGVAAAFAQITPEVEAATVDLSSYRAKLTEAYNAESQALQATISRMGSFGASLRDLNKSALLGGLSPLSPMEKRAEAKSQFEAVAAAARAGDEKAQDRYNDAYTAFVEASRAVFASSAEFQLDFGYAQAMTAEMAQWADTRVSVDQAQLDALKAQVSGIIEVNASVLSVRDALREYNEQVAKSTAPLVPAPAPIPYYPSEGRTNDAALAIEMASLRQEVAGLRSDQQQQTGDQIKAHAEAVADSAVKIAKAVVQPWKFKNDETRVSPE